MPTLRHVLMRLSARLAWPVLPPLVAVTLRLSRRLVASPPAKPAWPPLGRASTLRQTPMRQVTLRLNHRLLLNQLAMAVWPPLGYDRTLRHTPMRLIAWWLTRRLVAR